MKEKIDRLSQLLIKIKAGYDHEYMFDSLYDLLLGEYNIEGREEEKGYYWNHLKQTMEKQAQDYINAKKRRPKKGAPDEYESFVRNFKHDVVDELNRLDS